MLCICGLQVPFCIGKYGCYYVLPPLYSAGHMAMNADLVSLLPFWGFLCVLLHMRKYMCIAASILPMFHFIGSIFTLPLAPFNQFIAGMYNPPPFFGL